MYLEGSRYNSHFGIRFCSISDCDFVRIDYLAKQLNCLFTFPCVIFVKADRHNSMSFWRTNHTYWVMILLITNKFLTCNLINVFEVHRLRIELLELVQPEPVGLLYSGGQRPQEVFGGHENLKQQKKNFSQRLNKIGFSFSYDAFSCSELRTE